MTAMLACDGCGQIVSDRPEDEDPTGSWWCLTKAPMIEGGLMGMVLPTLSLSEAFDDEPEPDELPPPEPSRHFCSEDCGETWFRRRREEREDPAA